LSDLASIEVEEISPAGAPVLQEEYSWLEQTFIRVVRWVPGMRRAAPDRLLTAFRGSTWAFVGYGGSQLLRLVSMVVLARHLLGPQAFGLVALVNVFISGLNLLTDLGIGTDVIQHRRGDEPAFIDTAFLIQAGRGAILWALASALAYPFAKFYHQPEVLPLALVASVTVLVSGFTSGSNYTLMRHVRLERLTLLRMGAEAIGLAVSVTWAIVSPTAWALVLGRVAAESTFALGSHFITDQKMSLRWDRNAAKDILAFGAGMFASSATYFLAGEAERLVVGKFVDLIVLGCFSLALSITSTATSGVQRILQQVFYPMIATSARESEKVAERHYAKTKLMLLVLCGSMAVIFIVGGKWIVAILLGPKYVMAGWILRLLGFRAALDLFTSATTQMLFALGTSKYAAYGNLSKLMFLGFGLTVAFWKFGFHEAILVLAISPIFAYIPLLVGIRNHFRVAFWTEVTTYASLIATSGAAALAVRALA
jgi:O-antigen/teichoic acid export membrane protein